MFRISVILIVVMLSVPLRTIVSAAYRIEGIDPMGRRIDSIQMNNLGVVVFSVLPEIPAGLPPLIGEAFLVEDQVRTSLGSLGGLSIVSGGINDNAQVVGKSLSLNFDITSFLYDQGELTDLGIDGPRGSLATSINNNGEIVGQRVHEIGASAFHLTSSGVLTDLGTLGGDTSIAKDINELGQIVGSARNSLGRFEAFFTEGSGLQALGTIGGPTSSANAINDNAVIVGSSTAVNFIQHAALFTSDGSPIDLAPTWAQSGASDINNNNQIVGFVTDTPDQQFHGALFSPTGPPVLLKDLIAQDSGWDSLGSAAGINNAGQIVGVGRFNGEPRIFLMSPIPEPISLDIKPGSDENPVNLKSRGVLPMAILSTDDFDTSDIDVETLLFGDPLLLDNGGMAASPLRYAFEDVSDDGLVDLTLKFSIPELVDFGALGPESIAGLLTGTLFDGTPIEGTDSIRIVPSKGRNVNSLQTSATPEPTTLALALLGTAVLLSTRRES